MSNKEKGISRQRFWREIFVATTSDCGSLSRVDTAIEPTKKTSAVSLRLNLSLANTPYLSYNHFIGIFFILHPS